MEHSKSVIFVSGTLPCDKLLLHWSVLHCHMTLRGVTGCGSERCIMPFNVQYR